MPTNVEQNIRNILDSNLFGASIARLSGELIYANPALLQLFKTTSDNFIGRNAAEFYFDETQRAELISLLEINGSIPKIDVKLKRDNGSTFEATLSFMKTNYAGDDAYFCWFYDLTERLEMEKELANQIKKNLHHSKLAAIGELAAGIAHEINNPLTIVNISLRKLKKLLNISSSGKDSIVDSLESIENAVSRIIRIVNSMRNFSRIDSEKKERIDLVEVVNETYTLVSEIFISTGIDVKIIKNIDTAQVQGSRGQLQQVIINILTNARDALLTIDEKKIVIEITENKSNYLVKIADNGVGVESKLKYKVFEPFYTTKGFHKGTGIGLSMSYNIVKEHGGLLSCEDNPPLGAMFVISLPKII